jgi:glycosyltransferase involved in cell wall biosynthesis
MLFVGDGPNRKEMENMVADFGLDEYVTFAGKIYDRNAISKIYLRSSALLFPSIYDTDALVKREAAACGCPTVFVKGSNAAQEISEKNGFLIENSAKDLAATAKFIIENKEKAKLIGEYARQTVYRSWEDAVSSAVKRYRYLIDWKKNNYQR